MLLTDRLGLRARRLYPLADAQEKDLEGDEAIDVEHGEPLLCAVPCADRVAQALLKFLNTGLLLSIFDHHILVLLEEGLLTLHCEIHWVDDVIFVDDLHLRIQRIHHGKLGWEEDAVPCSSLL